MVVAAFLLVLVYTSVWSSSGLDHRDYNIVFDDSFGFGRQFDGIGGLSGGGVSVLYIIFLLVHIFMLTILNLYISEITPPILNHGERVFAMKLITRLTSKHYRKKN